MQSESARFQAGYQQLRTQNLAREQPVTSTPAPAMGGMGHGNRMVLPPQVQIQTHLQPTPVPSDLIFQQAFSSQAVQGSVQREDMTVSGAPGGLQPTDSMAMATPFGRGIALPMGPAGGRQAPTAMGAAGLTLLGGLQQAQMMTLRDRPILSMPTEPAIAPPPSDTRVVYDANSQSFTYYGTDAAASFFHVLPHMHVTDWAQSSGDT